MRPSIVIALLALALVAATPAAGADEGTVTFRLTIRGDPVPTDSFTLGVDTGPGGPIISIGVLCGPGSEIYRGAFAACEAGDYEATVGPLPAGSELMYTFARFTDYRATGGASDAHVLLERTVTVAAGTQTITLVYDYSLGLLPDTSMQRPERTLPPQRQVPGSACTPV